MSWMGFDLYNFDPSIWIVLSNTTPSSLQDCKTIVKIKNKENIEYFTIQKREC
jgi:MinD superfamily P-loop ATPase